MTVCGERNRRSASRGWWRRSRPPRAPPLALGQRRAGGRLVGLEDRHAEADHPHRAGDVGGGPVLGDEAGGAGGARGVRGDPAGPGDHQDVGRRDDLAQPLADRRAGLLADEQVHERDVRLVALGHRQRLLGVARAQAALDPGLLAEHQPQPPVHDLVVVDDEHAQAPVARAPRPPPGAAGLTSGVLTPAPPSAPARCPARARRTRRSRPPAAPPARRA